MTAAGTPASDPSAPDLRPVILGLMLSENMGDVHDEIIQLCRLAGIPEPDGDFVDGWTDDDLRRVGAELDEDNE